MEKLYNISAAVLLVLCYVLTITCALPLDFIDDGDVIDNTENEAKACQLCLLYDVIEACDRCTRMESMDKRGAIRPPLFHPLFRGGYPKPDSYKRYYSPLLSDEFPKKAFNQIQPVYHPFLRGGFTGYRPTTQQRSSYSNSGK